MSKKRDVNILTLRGLNGRDTINGIEDGWCEKAHNVVCREGKFQNVCEYRLEKSVMLDGYTILYIHPIVPDDEYIALKGSVVTHIQVVDGIVLRALTIKVLPPSVDNSSVVVSHFEEILFVRYFDTVTGNECSDSYRYENGRYVAVGIESLKEIDNVDIKYDYFLPQKDVDNDPANRMITFFTATDAAGSSYVTGVDKRYESIYASIENGNYIHGAVYLIFAFKMKDGSIVRNSKIHVLDGERGRDNSVWSLSMIDKSPNERCFFKDVYGFKATLNFSEYAAKIDNESVKSIMVYSTRNTPLYDFDGVYNNFPTDAKELEPYAGAMRTSAKYVLDKRNLDVASSPFYLLTEVDFRSIYSVTLTAADYKNIEARPIYSPLVAPHNYFAAGSVNINHRLHQYNIVAQLYKPALPVLDTRSVVIETVTYNKRKSIDADILENIGVSVTLSVGGEKVSVTNTVAGHLYWKVMGMVGNEIEYFHDPYIIIPNIVSYPDVRATKMDIFFTRVVNGVRQTIVLRSYDLIPSPANNYASYRKMGQDAMIAYDVISVNGQTDNHYTPYGGGQTFKIANQLMVSEPGQPHLFYPQHIYYVGEQGETAIESANMPIDQLTESRFGQYPLYLFTTSGIYALEQGVNELLYNSIVKVNNDIIAAGSNSIGADGALYYFASGGVVRLSGHVSKVVSDVTSGQIDDFMSGARLLYTPRHGELLLVNGRFDYAYICSLRNGVWSSRDFKGQVVGYGTIIDGNFIYNLFEEDSTKRLKGSIVTRELNLGSRQMKRLERLKVDILTTKEYAVTVYGSLDGSHWCEIAREKECDYIVRTASSWRWFKIGVEGDDFVLDSLITESYCRFVRHIK